MTKLTPTSYALLGLLARKPWSAYELNAHMQRSVLSAFWPRAASHVYSEPKKLLAHKLVTASQEQRSGRGRTVYTITAAGHKALRDWLASPTETYVTMSHEAMLKFLYAESGSRKAMEDNLDAIEANVLAEARAIIEGVRPLLSKFETMEGMPYNGMALTFLADVMEAQVNWVREVRASLAGLKETKANEESRQVGLKAYHQLINRIEALVNDDQ